MAVPSSGQLRLRADIANEVDGSATGVNVSLQALSRSAGKTTPDGMLEFYGYSASVAPSVSTSAATGITNSQFIANANVSSDGGAAITQRGFYIGPYGGGSWSANTKYIVSGTTGAFSFTLTGQAANTTMYITAYAINASGTTIANTVSVATYPTMNYQVQTASSAGQSEQYFNNWAANTPNGYGSYNDTLQHPYLGGISLEVTNFSGVNVGTTLGKGSRKNAYKTSDWGSTLCRTDWRCDTTVLYQYWQNSFSNGDALVFFNRWNTDGLTVNYGWSAQGSSSFGYGGWGGGIFTTGEYNGYLFQAATNLTVWHIYDVATVYK